jgi:hypothetical protein
MRNFALQSQLLIIGVGIGIGLTACQLAPTRPSSTAANSPSPSEISLPRPSPIANPQQSGQPYPNEVVSNFMAGCTGAKVTASACKCTITRLQQTYSYDEFTQINQEMGQGKPAPKSFEEIVAACKQA